jgi:hypothetical protein
VAGKLLGVVIVLMAVGTGIWMILAATNIIPTDDRDFGAPRWIVAAIGVVFLAMGACFVLASRVTEAQRGLLGAAFALVFLTATSMFLTWAVLAGAEGRSDLRIGGVPVPLPSRWQHWLGQGLVASCAVLMDTLTVIAWWLMGRHVWRGLGRDPAAR